MSDTIRTFIAIEIPEEIKEKLTSLTNLLKDNKDKVTWVSSNNIHLTLKFLGNISIQDVESAKNILIDVVKNHSSFNAAIRGVGTFPNGERPRVVWIGVDTGKEKAQDIFNDLEGKLNAAMGIPKEDREFTPHFTLGRIKYLGDADRFLNGINKHKEDLFGNLNVDSISLIKSTLSPKGSIYETLHKAELKKYKQIASGDNISG